MSGDPLRMLTTVPREVFPVLDALARLHRDVGSMKARHALPHLDPPDRERLICVGCVDEADVAKLSRDLAHELRHDPLAAERASKVAVMTFDDGLCVVAFLLLPCTRANDQPEGRTHP